MMPPGAWLNTGEMSYSSMPYSVASVKSDHSGHTSPARKDPKPDFIGSGLDQAPDYQITAHATTPSANTGALKAVSTMLFVYTRIINGRIQDGCPTGST